MKCVFSISLLAIIFSLKYCRPVPQEKSANIAKVEPQKIIEEKKFDWIFTEKEGYVTRDEIYPFLQYHDIDTNTNCTYRDNSVVGKYYSYPGPGHILLYMDDCGSEMGDPFHLMELKNTDGKIEIIQSKIYFHGNYDCCQAGYESFQKYGDFFCIKMCGTGSAFCAGDLYLFKDSFPIVYEEKCIPIHRYAVYDIPNEHAPWVTYDAKVKNIPHGISLRYKYKSGIWPDDQERIIKRKLALKVDYLYNDSLGWYIKDSTIFKKYIDGIW